MWFALTGIVMLFAAFTSALVVRKGMSFDWVLFRVPRVLWLNTFLLMASSVTLELSRRSLGAGAAKEFVRWLSATVVLGLGFLGGQLIAWRELAARGIYLATNPGSSRASGTPASLAWARRLLPYSKTTVPRSRRASSALMWAASDRRTALA